MIEETRFIAEEHPEGDKFQLMMLGIFLAIWITDSFIVRATLLNALVPWYLRIGVGSVLALYGVHLVNESHKLVIDADVPKLIDWGVYSVARHPMYLGIILVYLGLAVSTVSVASLLILVGIFYIYDRIAEYEETQIIKKHGERYKDYSKNVRRWMLV